MISGSKEELLDLIKRFGTLSVDEASVRTDLAKTTLREHFLQLERDGYIKREYIRSGPGRPSLQYQLTRKGHRIYPSYEGQVLRDFLKFLKKTGNDSIIEDFFVMFWQQRLENASQAMEEAEPDHLQHQLEIFTGLLKDEGFMPVCESHNGENRQTDTFMLRECNCPFREVVEETRLPCRLELEIYKKLFGKNVERVSYMLDGDFSCTYKIPAK